ncbi:ornithine cyclodeaminase family protein [Sporolactobacillus sp. THM7-4]|nr:ornithine cyclodeaminase family protein [Sporolactobacillus sp. THM7-4]
MLALSKNDIFNLITMDDAMDAIEQAYQAYHSKQFLMPQRTQITKDNKDTLLFMPCFSAKRLGSKIVTVFPENAKKALPSTQGLMLLNDSETGNPLAIMDGTFLTAFRTGAVGGVAIRHLTEKKKINLGLIGTGVQGKYLVLAACRAKDVSNIYLYNRTQSKIPQFIQEVKQGIDREPITFHICENTNELVQASDVVITATTSYQPVLPDRADILVNKLFIGIGSYQPDMREFPKALYSSVSKIYIDTSDASAESGDIITPLKNHWIPGDRVVPFSTIIAREESISQLKNKTILFKSVGMSLFDLFVANVIYDKAVQHGVGKNID